MIAYKGVQKPKDGKYYSIHSPSYFFEIGETYTSPDCDNTFDEWVRGIFTTKKPENARIYAGCTGSILIVEVLETVPKYREDWIQGVDTIKCKKLKVIGEYLG